MSAIKTPEADATAEEWGRLAVSIPGWRWMPGMRWVVPWLEAAGRLHDSTEAAWYDDPRTDVKGESVPDPDDPATAGCLLALLGTGIYHLRLANMAPDGTALWQYFCAESDDAGEQWSAVRLPLGRACIAAAASLGRWPGGEQ